MKKALALILALLMLCSTMVTFTSAETTSTEIDLKAFYDSNNYASTYVGAALSEEAAKPAQDGVINDGEYQVEYVVAVDGTKDVVRNGVSPTVLLADYKEYVAHDADWIYVAFDFVNGSTNSRGRLYWNLSFITDFTFNYAGGASANTAFTQGTRGIYDGLNLGFEAGTATEAGATAYSTRNNAVTSGTAPVDGTDFVLAVNNKTYTVDGSSATTHQIYEIKLSKAWYAEQVGLSGASDVKNLAWTTVGQYINKYASGYTQIGHFVSDAEKAALEETYGVAYTGNSAGSSSHPYDNNALPRLFILDEAPTDWEALVEELGLTIHVDPVDEAPVLDGVISDGEYSKTRTTTLADLGNPTEIQSDLTEYYAHDGDFIYYAATFTQATDNRAFWPQWKVDNKFDIFNDSTVTDNYYHARINTQVRYIASGTYLNGGIGTNCGYRAPVDGTEFFYAGEKDANNVKTYEIKIAKSYFAELNNCEPEDIKVFPYFISFHAAFSNTIPLSSEAQAKLTAAGATYVDTTCYNFVVLDGETTASKPTDWEQVAEDAGFNIHVQPVTKTPVLDGVISEGEYPTSRTTALADLSAGANGELQGENVVEYFGHDAEYIYYAAVYTRATAGRAFWPRFKMENSFDIFNANYGQHVAVQLRLSNVPHTYQNGLGGYGSYVAPTFSSASTYGFADVIAEAGRVDNVETFEVKIAKSYIANANDITNDDVKVLPYYTWFHASTAVGNKMTAEQNAAITAAGGVAPAVGALSYNFMVLDGETIKVEDRLSITTNETASIRLSPSNAGIRFKSNIDTVDLIALVSKYGAENVKVGTLITLEEILGENELTADAAFQTVDVEATVATPFTRVDGVNTYAGSLTNLNPNNFAKNFAARGYIAYRADAESEWTYIYSDVTALRSAAYVANQALESGNYAEDAAALEILNAYAAAQAN